MCPGSRLHGEADVFDRRCVSSEDYKTRSRGRHSSLLLSCKHKDVKGSGADGLRDDEYRELVPWRLDRKFVVFRLREGQQPVSLGSQQQDYDAVNINGERNSSKHDWTESTYSVSTRTLSIPQNTRTLPCFGSPHQPYSGKH